MKIIVLLGPTGVGKTKLSIYLAKKYNAQIINADATQIYIEPSIGTAKITKEEMDGIPHHMLNLVSLKTVYTVKDYQKDARTILDKLIKENKNVIIVGGSGLYIKALLYNYQFEEEEITFNYDNLTNEELKRKVDQIYIDNNIHVNNRKRLVRFLSHYEATGNIIKNTTEKDKPLYDFTLIGLTALKDELYLYLEKRVREMIETGLIEETKKLNDLGLVNSKNLIGYKEINEYLNGVYSLEEAIEKITTRTKKYAKRQYTWIRNQFTNVEWFMVNYNSFEETIKKIEAYLESL